MHSKAIDAEILETVPDEFVVVTEEVLNEYPALREAIETQSYAEADPDEWKRTIKFLDEKGSSVIKVGDEYYGIEFMIVTA